MNKKDTSLKVIMNFVVSLLMFLIFVGCASHPITPTFSVDDSYDFRKVRWGFSKERVELAEVGTRLIQRYGNTIVYKYKLNEVNCQLIYTFKENRLRTAGYYTKNSSLNADNIIEKAIELHGEPEKLGDGWIWTTTDTLIYTNIYTTVTKLRRSQYQHTPGGGLLEKLPRRERQETGSIAYGDAMLAYVDKSFFYQLSEMNYPEDELSFYEKMLMGVIQKAGRTVIPGLGTIPR